MKNLKLIVLLLFVTTRLVAQDFPYNEEEKIEFEEIFILEDGLTKNDVLDRTEKWAKQYWSEPNQLSKSEQNITYKASSKSSRNVLWAKSTFELFFNVRVSVKDNKYKYTLSDFEVIELSLMKYTLEKRVKKKKIREFAWAEIQNLIKSLTSAIKTGNISNEKDDW